MSRAEPAASAVPFFFCLFFRGPWRLNSSALRSTPPQLWGEGKIVPQKICCVVMRYSWAEIQRVPRTARGDRRCREFAIDVSFLRADNDAILDPGMGIAAHDPS